MSKRLILFYFGLFFFIQFIIFSYFVHKNIFTHLDFNMTVRLQDHISRRFDDIFSFFSDIGKAEVMTVILLVILFFRRKLLAGFITVCLYIVFHLIEIYGKFFVSHPPPPQFMLRTKQIVSFPQFTVRTENSYPSGHAGRTFFISAFLLVLIWNSKKLPFASKCILSGIIMVFDGIMIVSRIYLGEHWTTDIVGGTMLGISFGLFSSAFLFNVHTKEEPGKVKEKRRLLPKYKIEIKRIEE